MHSHFFRCCLLLLALARGVIAQDVTPPTLISTTLSGNIVTFVFSEPMSTQFGFRWFASPYVSETNITPQAWSADKRSATVLVNLPTDTTIVFILNNSDFPPAFRDLAGNFLAPDTYADDVSNSSARPPSVGAMPVPDTPTPLNQLLTPGANVALRFLVLGSKPRTVQWLRNGIPIPDATNQFLQLANVSASDVGNYVLTVTNSFGSSASSPIAVSIIGTPTIQTQPQSQTATAGANVTFQVSASGAAPLFYQWQLNGASIADATNATLTVNSVTTAKAGNYSVVVSNSVGSVTSAPPAVLTVNRLSQTITFGALANKQVGDAAFTLGASASSGLAISYASSNPGVATVSGNAVTIVGTGTTTITASQGGDATYLPATSVGQSLTVNPTTPAITSATNATATAGQSFTYTITANNNPTGFGATGLPAGLNVNGASGLILGIPTAAGTFNVTLSATNAGGVGNASLTLTVNLPPPPSITVQPQGQTLNVGASVTFSVTATGTAPLSYQWQKDGTNLASATGTSYVLASVQTNHAGSYTVVVGNFGGSVTSSPALLMVNRLSQSITFGALSANQFGNTPFMLTATSSSGLPISFSSSQPSVATVSGSTVTLVAAGTTSITASQPGDATYLPAASVSQSLLVNPATPVITSAGTATAIAGQPFSYTITANNGPIGFDATGLPTGLSVNTATGVISGTPAGASTNTVTLSATNAGGTGTKTLTLTVLPAAPVITSAATATAIISQPFTYQITASGSPSSFNAANLPVGLSVNTTFGLISGTPTLLGTNVVTLFATNSGGTGTGTVTLAVRAAPPSITIQPRSHTVTNDGFNFSGVSVEAIGTAPLSYQWRLNGTNLPGETFTNVSFTLQFGQAANYSVVVSNIAGSITSSVARVVLVPPPFSSGLTGWGLNDHSQITPPNDLSNLLAVAAIAHRNLGLKNDGTVIAWGENVANSALPPGGLSNVIALAAGYSHSLALKEDGTLIGWGGQTVPAGLSNVLAIAAGADHCMALKSDGTVAVWGVVYVFSNGTLVSTSPAPSPPAGLSNVVAIAAGWHHCLALRSDGTVVGWGENDLGQATPPAGLSNVVAIAGNTAHSLALRADGVVVGWGQSGAFGKATPPATLTNAIAIAAGSEHSLALRSDGTVVGWGYNGEGQISIPAGLSNVVQIAAGFNHSLALTGSKPEPRFTRASVSTNGTFTLTAASFIRQPYVTEGSADFLTWLPVSTNQPIGSFLQVTDPMPPGQPRRFYRVVAP